MMAAAMELALKAQKTGDKADISAAADAASGALYDAIDAAELLAELTGYDRMKTGLDTIFETDVLQSALADLIDDTTDEAPS